jgi:autotransporter-associated beta strand protein
MKKILVNRVLSAQLAALALLILPGASHAATTGIWNVDSGGLWSATGNWSGGVPSAAGDTASLTYNITAARIITNDVSRSVGILNIGDSVTAFFPYTLTNNTGVTFTFNNSGNGASLVQANTTATDVIGTPVVMSDNLNITNSSALTISGIISAGSTSYNLNKAGAGTLTLSGVNTYGGLTAINAGTVAIAADTGLGAAPGSAVANQLTLNGGTLAVTAAGITLAANRGITLGAGNGTIDVSSLATSSTTTIGGIIAGSGWLTLKSSGDMTPSGGGASGLGIKLNSANTFNGNVTITSGLVAYAGDSSFGNATNVIVLNGGGLLDNNVSLPLAHKIQVNAGGGTFRFWGTAAPIWSSTISGSGNINKTDGGSVTFSGDLSGYTGSFNNESTGNITLTGAAAASIGGNWNVTNTMTVNSTANQSLGGVISGPGTIVKNGTGTLTLTGVNTGTGVTTISGGTLALGGAGKLGSGTYAANITDNAAFVDNSSVAQTLSGIISGTGTLTQQGAGGLTLSGVNTFTGATAISGGTLTIGGAGQLGSGNYVGLITNNAVLVYNSSAAQTLSGVISGTGTLTQQGTGILTLSGANTYSGATTVSAGELVGVTGGSVNSVLTVASGATNSVQVLATGGQWSCTGLTYNTGTATADFNFFGAAPSTTTAPVQVNGNVNINGTLNTIVRGGGFVVGTYPLIKYTGTLTGNPTTGTLTLPNGMIATIINNTGNNSIDLNVTVGDQITWATGSGTWDINTTANWQNTSSSSVNYLDGNAVQFEDTLSGASPITVTLNTIVSPAAVTANDSSKNYTISGTGGISGSASLIKNGTGTLTLSTSNSFTGPTLVTAGVLQFGTNTAFGSSAIVTNTGTLDLNGFDFTGPMFNRPITISGTGVGGTVITNSATARGRLHYVVLGADATIASANPIFIGGSNAVNGTLALGVNNLTVGGTNSVMLNGLYVSGSGNITITNSATLYLSDNYTGGNQQNVNLTNNNGYINIYSGASMICQKYGGGWTVSTPIVLNGGTFGSVWPSPNGLTFNSPIILSNNGTINMNGAGYGNCTFAGPITGTGGLTVAGDGSTRTFTGTNSYGWTTITNGPLQIGNAGTTGTLGLGPVTNYATLAFKHSDSLLVTNQISGPGVLTQVGTGTVILYGTNTYSGATTISAGELVGVSGSSCSNSAVTVGTGATNGVLLLAANGQWACGSLTIGSQFGDYCFGDFNFGGFAPSSSTAALLVNGNLAIKGFYNVIVRNTTLVVGQYPLIQYTGTLSGTPPALPLSIPAGAVAYISNNVVNKSLDLVVTATSYSTAIWAIANGVWDINTTFNWTNAAGSPITYQEGNAVVFNNPSSASTVTLNTAVNPAALANGVAVNNTANYIVTGTGAIAGSGGLTKAGSGELTLATANTYSGGTTLSAGTIRASTTDSALGTGPLTVTASAKLATANGGGARTLANPVVVSSGQTLSLDAGYANLTLNGSIGGAGSLSATAGGTVTLGGTNTIASTLTLNSGTVVVPTGGATTNLGGGISVGLNGVLNIQSGATLSGLWLRTGDGSGANNSIINQVGGTVTLTTTDSSNGGGSTTRLGHWSTSGNVYNLNGGILNCTSAVLNNGWDGASQIAINGGTANLMGLAMGALGHGGGADTFILSSGTLKIGSLGITNTGAGAKTFNLGAGTVGSLAAWGSPIPMTLIDSNTGTTFDTTGGAISLGGSLTGIGSLNKSGANNLNLSGTNNYAGNTTINAGTLQVTNAGSLTLLGNVSGAGTLAFSSGTTLNIGGPGNPTTLNVGTPLTLSGANLVYDLPDPNLSLPSDTIAMAGSPTLTLTGTTTVTPTGPLANGTYNLITGAGTITGTAANLALAASATSGIRGTPSATFTVSSPTVTLAISGDTGAQPLTWLGTNGANWDLSSTINWVNNNSTSLDKFYSLDNVTFDDTFPNSSNNVSLVGALYPTTVTIGSNTRNYNFGGSGSIAGAAALTMNGGSTLTISNANSFVGGTTISGGKLRMANPSALGIGPLMMSGGILDLNSNNLSTLSLSGTGGVITDGYTNGGVSVTRTLTVNQMGSNTFAGTINNGPSNTVALTANGPGYLTLSGASTYTGTTTVNAGTLEVTNGPGNPTHVVQPGATLKIGYNLSTTAYTSSTTVNGAGTNSAAGLYLKSGISLNRNNGVILATAPSVIRSYGGTTAATLHGFDTGSLNFQVQAAASGSWSDAYINYDASGGGGNSYGYNMNIISGANNATGDFTVNGLITGGGGGLRKQGTGSLQLTGANTYTSPLQITAGNVILSGGNNRLPVGSSVILSSGTLLQLNGISQTLTNVSSASTGGSVVGGSAVLSTLTITNAGADAYAGNLGGPSVNQNNLALVKTGAGLLTLSGQLTYNGSTTISAGSVLASSLTVADGAALTLPDVAGTLTATNLALGTSAGSTLAVTSFAGAGSAPIVVTNLSTAGTVTVTLAGSLALGEYPLIKYSGTIGGAGIGAFQLLRGLSGIITNNLANSSVDVILTGTNIYPLVWKGNNSTNWDVSTTTNWAFNVLPSTYKNGDNVQFDDTSVAGSNNVALNLTVTASGFTVTNNTINYTISGNGALAGNIGLTKNGSASLTLLTTNTFTGATVINGGTVSIATITNGGVASSLGAANNNPTNIVLNGGTLAYTGLNTASDRGITLTTNNGTIAVIGGNNLTLNGAANSLTGSGSLTKNGNGTLTLSTLNNYTGTTVVNGGTLVSTVWEWYGRRGIGSGLLTINSGATAEFTQVHGFGVSIDGRAAVINGGTLQLDSGNYVLGLTMTGGLVNGAGLTVSGTGLTVTANAAATTAVISNNISAGTYSGTVGTTLIVSNGVAPVGLELDGNLTDGGIALNLTKNGAGTALLTGANTYSGNTTINGGTLLLSNLAFSASSPVITLKNNSTLNVSNLATIPLVLGGSQTLQGSGKVLGAVSDSGGTTIIPGGTTNVGTLSFSSDLILAGSDNLNFDLGKTPTSLGGTNNDQITVAGNLTINPGTVININPVQLALAGGTYKLIAYTGTLIDNSGGIATAWTTAGYTPSGRVTGIALSSATPGEIDLIVSGSPANLVWQGDGGANAWDTTTANWLNGVSSDLFYPYDNVLFNDSSINTNVDIQAAVTPSSVVVSNNVNHYTFINDQGINGGTGLIKNGTGTLTILNNNPYTGVTTINQGTLEIGDGATVDGSLTASPIVDNATLKFNVVSGQSPATAISGPGTVVVQSPNNPSSTLTLDAVNSWTGGLNILSGIAQPGVNNALPAGESVTVASGAAYDFNGINNGNTTTQAYSFTIAGAGPDSSSGALVNNGASIQGFASVSNLTLTADATVGGNSRWDIGYGTVSNSTFNGNGHVLTKAGGADFDIRMQTITNVAGIHITSGNVYYENYSQTNSWTANTTNILESGAKLGIYGSQTINVPIVANGGTIDNQGSGVPVFSGPVDVEQPTTFSSAGGSLVFAGTITTNPASGSLSLTGNNIVSFAGNDTVPVASMGWTTGTVQLGYNSPSGSVPDAAITVPSGATFSVYRSDLYTLTNIVTGDGNMSVLGTNGLVVNSANINIGGTLSVGQGAYGKLLIQPGANITANGLFLGNPASSVGGDVVQTGGLLTTTNASTTGYFRIGHWATETSSYAMFGGTNIVDGILSVGWDGTGSLRQTNGLINVGLELEVPMSGHGGPGTYALEGGSIIIGGSGIYCGGGSSVIYLGGGTVGASTNWSTTASMTLTGTNGNTTFDTGIYTNTLGGVLSGAGGLVKASSGTLILSSGSAYTYAGDTIINGGTLTINGSAVAGGVNKLSSGTVWVNPGATLNLAAGAEFNYGAGTPAVVLNNSTLAMTDGQYNYIKNITLTNGATWALGTGSLVNGLTGANFNLATVNSLASANTSVITSRGGALAMNSVGGIVFNVARGTAASDLTVSAVLTDYNGILGNLTKTGNGILTLNAANSYTGSSTISAGTLALGSLGSIGYSTNIVIAGGAMLDASANYFPLSSSQTLGNTNGTAILGGNVNATAGKLALAYAAGTPALNVTNGTLTLAPATTIKVNNTGASLPVGSYKLISKATGGAVAGTAPVSAVVVGNGLAAGTTNALQITAGELFLNVGATVSTTPTNIVSTISGNTLTLSWPADHTGWRLQVQTNSLNTGLGTNWVTWPYSDSTTNNSVSVTMNPNAPTVFFRMVYP